MSAYTVVVWDGTPRYGRHLCVDEEARRAAPPLPRQQAQQNRAEAVRHVLAIRGPLSMREILVMVPGREKNTCRRAVYLLAQRGHLTYTTRPVNRHGTIERVYALRSER